MKPEALSKAFGGSHAALAVVDFPAALGQAGALGFAAMNLVLSFVHPSKPAKSVGPFEAIRMDGETVREVQNRTVVARHREHQWEVDGERYFRLDATTRVHIHFERPPQGEVSRQFGPYARFSAIDGIVYTDDRVFAFVDPRVGDWFCYNDGQHWPVMVVSDAATAGMRDRLGMVAALAPLLGGVIGLWKRGRLLYLGRAESIGERLAELAAGGRLGPDIDEITALTWEVHSNPAVREAELLAEYQTASRGLVGRYGLMQGNLARTSRLIELAHASVALARSLSQEARRIRLERAATS